jgi:RES domain-containing protein
MMVYRICNSMYADDISGTGAKLFGARWNSKGIEMLYVTEHISLAALEMLVHNQFKDFSIELSLLNIFIPESAEIKEIKTSKLKTNWIEDISYTRFIGDEFINSKNAAVLQVPSAVITEENNFLINPLHPDFKKIKINTVQHFRTDKRLFSIK